MTPSPDVAEGLNEAETQVYFLLRKYRPQKHYRATTAAGAVRYAIFARGGGQITEPMTSKEANEAAAFMTAREIVSTLREYLLSQESGE